MQPSPQFAALISSGEEIGWAHPARALALRFAENEMSVDGAWHLNRMTKWLHDEAMLEPALVRSFRATLASDPGPGQSSAAGFVSRGVQKKALTINSDTNANAERATAGVAPRQTAAGDFAAQYDASAAIRDEFPTKKGYELFMRAQSEGRVHFLKAPGQRLESSVGIETAGEIFVATGGDPDDELARAERRLDQALAEGRVRVIYHGGNRAASVPTPTAHAPIAPAKKLPAEPAQVSDEYGAQWDKSENLQAEFPTRKGYELFMKAQSEGRVRLYQR